MHFDLIKITQCTKYYTHLCQYFFPFCSVLELLYREFFFLLKYVLSNCETLMEWTMRWFWILLERNVKRRRIKLTHCVQCVLWCATVYFHYASFTQPVVGKLCHRVKLDERAVFNIQIKLILKHILNKPVDLAIKKKKTKNGKW